MRSIRQSLHFTNYLLRLRLQSNLYHTQLNTLPTLHTHSCSRQIPNRLIRFYSQSQEENYFKGPPKRKNFIRRFIDNVKEGMEAKEFQTNLQGLEEETTRLKESKVLQAMQEHLKTTKESAGIAYKSGTKFVGEKSEYVRAASSEAYEKIKSSKGMEKSKEYAYKLKSTAHVAQEKISVQTQKVKDTETYKKVSYGVKIVKEELIDDIIEESQPYKRPESIRKRTEPSLYTKYPKMATVAPDDQTTSLAMSQGSVYGERIAKFLKNNPVVNLFSHYKIKYDESDNLVIRGVRTVTENIGDLLKSNFSQTEMVKVMSAIKAVDPHFTMENFIQQCQHDIIPNVLEAFLRGNLEVLKTWCHEAAFNVLSAYFKQNYNDVTEARILEIYNADILTVKMLDSLPVLFLMFEVQQVLTKLKGSSNIEQLEKVRYIWALSKDLENYDSSSSWRVLEFSIHETRPLLV